MQQKWVLSFFFLAFALSFGSASGQMSKLNPISEPSAAEFAETFRQGPGRDYSTGPLWTWNDRLTEQQIRETLRDLAAQHVKQVWVHPRPGLMTPYLTEEWFARWKEALDEAKKLDMNVWIYDENSYPSGFAGGFVPEAMPESRGKGLNFREVKSLDAIGEEVWYVYKINADGTSENVTESAKKDGRLAEGNWIIASISLAPSSPWFADKYYVDLLKPGVTQKFIELTFEAYKREVGEEFGKRVPGIFTDEPHLQTAGGITWNEEIPELFQKKYGYSLVDSAVSLIRPVGDWKKARHDYQRLLLDLFVERWARPCFDWCEANNLQFTGHYWEHGWPGASHGPDNMAMYIWHQRPSIDVLMNQYRETVDAQFGNVRIVKELSSVANQLGHARTLCELYGAGGWDLRFEDMKRQADWITTLGVNTINEHLSYVTIRGARKRDHPQSFSYHSPWFEGYHVLADHNTRVQYALSQGRQVNNILVIEPTTTGWLYQGEPKLREIGDRFQEFVNEFEKMNIEYDLGSEDIIERLGSLENGKLVVGKAKYDMVVLPPGLENLDSKTLELIANFAKAGSQVLYFELPRYVDGAEPGGVGIQYLKLLADAANAKKVGLEQVLIAGWNRTAADGLRVAPDGLGNVFVQANGILKEQYAKGKSDYEPPTDSGKVYHHRRRLGDQDVVFLTNVSIDEPASGWVYSNKDHVDRWCPDSGKITPYPCEEVGRPYIRYRYELPPCGSLLLVLSGDVRVANRDNPVPPELPKEWYFPPVVKKQNVFKPQHSPNGPEIKRLEPNVLTLDYLDVQVGEEKLEGVYFYKANNWAFAKNGLDIGITRNPWDNGVQFKDSLITKKFPENTGFSATYRFFVRDQDEGTDEKMKDLLSSLCIVIERADLYEITCNGTKVGSGKWEVGSQNSETSDSSSPTSHSSLPTSHSPWWLDRSFYKVDLSKTAKVGENEVVITTRPMSIYNEIEPAYLLGEFSLESAAHGFVVCPPQPLRLRAPEPAEPNESHSDAIEGVSWLTRGIGFGGADVRSGDAAPYLIIDLGKKVVVDRLKIWNYNERNLTRRGVKTMTVYTSPTADFNDPNKEELQTVTLKEGSSSGPQIVSLEGKRALPENQYLIFEIKSNWAGVEYPAPEKDWSKMPDRDCGFVGLSEVRFYSANPENLPSVPMSDTRSPEEEAELKRKTESGIPMYLEIKNVKIAKVSSELALGGFDRAAAHLLDGSGLEAATFEQGWNRQGMPFYAAGVSYKETFDLGQMMQCQYFVNLPDSPKGWYGATAKVIVNGKTAGYVMSAPWKVEITKLVRAGKNEIEVVVFGTPKNLLGPHHNGSGRGTAWPGMFWRGPEPQCPGADYDTIGYGLFEPFRVTREWAANP